MHDNALISLLQTLVRIPSVNPDDGAEPSISGEARMVDFLEDYLAARSFQTQRKEWTANRPNLIASYGPDKPDHTLLIEAHTDTVSVEGMQGDPFGGEVRDGRLYGRGASDMKGPMAAALHALQPDILERLAEVGVQVIFCGAMGEERGNQGAIELVNDGLRADEVLVLEPTDLNIVSAHKGAFWVNVQLTGRPGHGSAPEKGMNANHAAVQMLQDLMQRFDGCRQEYSDEMLGLSTMNIGLLQGGTGVNILAPSCEIELDWRLVPGFPKSLVLGELRSLLEALVQAGKLEAYSISEKMFAPPFSTPLHLALDSTA